MAQIVIGLCLLVVGVMNITFGIISKCNDDMYSNVRMLQNVDDKTVDLIGKMIERRGI